MLPIDSNLSSRVGAQGWAWGSYVCLNVSMCTCTKSTTCTVTRRPDGLVHRVGLGEAVATGQRTGLGCRVCSREGASFEERPP